MERTHKSALALTLIWLVIYSSAALGQNTAYTWANRGLLLRTKPSRHAEVMQKLAYGEEVQVLDTLSSKLSDTLVKGIYPIIITGNWLKIAYAGKTGYAFGGYISLVKPQQPDEFFNDAVAIEMDSVTRDQQKWPKLLVTKTTTNGSVYKCYADGDGCWSHSYLMKGLTFNDALMMMNENHIGNQCQLELMGIANKTYILTQCDATVFQTLKMAPGGVLYYTEDCN